MALYKDVADPAERKQKLIDNSLLVIDQMQEGFQTLESDAWKDDFNRLQYLRAVLKELRSL